MPEAVIVATARTPIGRANKGSLVDCRPDDLSATIVKALLDKVPALDPATIEDVIWGNAQPAGEAGYNVARVVGILAGLPGAPGTTVNRYCSSSLQTIRMAAHAIRSGEGDVFVSGGVETVSRFAHGMSDGLPGTHNGQFSEAEERTAKRNEGGQGEWTPFNGLPDIYIAMGQTAENVAEYAQRVARGDGRVRRTVAEPRRRRAGERLLRARDHAGHARRTARSSPRTTARGLTRPSRSSPTLKPVFRPDGTVTAGNACPLNDGAAAVIVMSDTRAEQLGIQPLARDRRERCERARPRDHGARPDRGEPPGAGPRRDDDRRHRPRRDQRGVRRAGDPVGASTSGSRGRSST